MDDITEKKRVESLLVESQERLEMALTASNTGLWDWYPLEGKDYHNDQWYRQLGYARDEFDDESDVLKALMHPEDAKAFKKNMAAFDRKKTDEYQQEFRMKAKNGSWKWILSLGRVQERDDAGRPRRIIGVHLDMTDRKHAEQEVKENLDELERFLVWSWGGNQNDRAEKGNQRADGAVGKRRKVQDRLIMTRRPPCSRKHAKRPCSIGI